MALGHGILLQEIKMYMLYVRKRLKRDNDGRDQNIQVCMTLVYHFEIRMFHNIFRFFSLASEF